MIIPTLLADVARRSGVVAGVRVVVCGLLAAGAVAGGGGGGAAWAGDGGWTAAAGTAAPASVGAGAGVDVPTRVYVVRKHDTLSGIANRELGDPRRVSEIMALNPEIRDAHQIRVAQEVRLPVDDAAPGQLSWVYGLMEDVGLLGAGALAGVGVILAVYLGVMAGGHLLVGGLLLWVGALLVGVSELGFWKSFGANLKATLLSVLAAVALWSTGILAYSFVSQENLATLGSDQLWPWVLGIVAGITAVQFLVYVNSVRGSLSIGFLRAIGACLMAALLEGAFVLFVTPSLAAFA